jgi:cyclopropane fatty-acyl-phospholipid synthase-like methyltransferase
LAVAVKSKSDPAPVPLKVPLKLRLKAWWEGCDVIVHQREAEAAPMAAPLPRRVIDYRDPDRPWQTPRAKLACMLWGEGFSHPGDTEHVLQLVKPFALDPAMTVVDLCAGLGGGARAIVEEFGVWVSGMEPDPELAEAGMQISTKAGLAKKAEIAQYDPAALDIRAGTVDCFLCRQLLHRVEDKPRFLRAVDRALKNRGQVVLTDYMLADPSRAESPAIKAWRDCEGVPLHLWTVEQYAAAFKQEGLEVRVTEDMTAPYRSMVLNGWAALTAATDGASLAPELVRALVDELERWTRRIAALESGDLKLVRFYALKDNGIRALSG